MASCIDVEILRTLCHDGKIKWTMHAFKRIRERKLSPDDIESCIYNGNIIESYPDDKPFPSCLVHAVIKVNHLHVVVSCDGSMVYFITAYYPDSDEWESDFATRKVKI